MVYQSIHVDFIKRASAEKVTHAHIYTTRTGRKDDVVLFFLGFFACVMHV